MKINEKNYKTISSPVVSTLFPREREREGNFPMCKSSLSNEKFSQFEKKNFPLQFRTFFSVFASSHDFKHVRLMIKRVWEKIKVTFCNLCHWKCYLVDRKTWKWQKKKKFKVFYSENYLMVTNFEMKWKRNKKKS